MEKFKLSMLSKPGEDVVKGNWEEILKLIKDLSYTWLDRLPERAGKETARRSLPGVRTNLKK